MSDPEKLPSNQVRAIAALLTGANQEGAAAAAGVVPRTLQRWLTEEGFTRELDIQKRMAIGAATARLVGTMDTAVTLINEILSGFGGPKKYHTIQLRAAKITLDSALKLIEINDVIKRLEALEQVYENNNGNR
jgi:hypothetical protein